MGRSNSWLLARVLLASVTATSLWCQHLASAETDRGGAWTEWSTWTQCSADCNSGVSSRSRQCVASQAQGGSVLDSTVCDGQNLQVKICFLKACPPDQPSPREAACSQYDTKVFSGRQYVWEPFIHPTDPCKLSCRAKGEHFYANLANRVEDGADCGNETAQAICVSGVCKRVGCDGVVESTVVKDRCGVCNGDGSTCRTISGIFTSTELQRGLNYVISIPSGSTNINITELQTSRNLLLLQTVAGKTFINGGTSSPTSGDVTAAGTVFTYGAKSPSNPKESIYSPGPTNITVVLKLLLRGGNPGIMYTFNVPQEVSGSVIEQIKHRAKPVEIPSGPLTPHSGSQNSNPDGGEVSDHSLPVTSTKTDTFDSQALHVSGDGENSDLNTNVYSSHDLPSEEEYDVESKGHFTNADHRDSRLRSNVDQNSGSSDSKQHLSESYAERIHQASRAVAASQAVSSGKAGSEQEEKYDTNYRVETGGTRHNSNYDGEDRVGEIKPRNGTQDKNADYENISTDDESYIDESYDDSEDELYIDNNNDSGFDVDDEEIREILKDHEAEFTDDNQYISEDISERPRQSVSIPLNSVMDPNEIDDWDPDRTSDYDDADSLNEEHDEDVTLEEDEEEKTRVDRYNSKKASFRQQSPSQGSISSFSDDTKEGNDDITDSSRKSLDRPHQDSAEQSGRPAQLPSPRNSFPIPTRYRVPKYSQSFTFAERYKDIYDSNSRRYSRHQRPRSHRHRHHQQQQHHRDSSVPSSELSSGSSGINQYPYTDQTNRNQNLPTHQSSTTHQLSPSRRYDDREEITSALELSSDTNSQDDSLDERQRDVNQHVSRERRLRDREALIAERRKQLEEQRNRYQQRLREYQERLRQRQAEYETSRRQSSGSTEARITDSRSRERENDRRHQNRHDTLTSEGVTRSSYEHRRNHEHRAHVVTPTPSYPDVQSGPGRSDGGSLRQSYIRSRTEPKTNTQRHGGQDFERRQPSGPQEPPSLSRQGEPLAGRSVIENRVPYATSSPTGQASRTYNSGGRATLEFSEGRTDSRIIPRVQQPPRQEVDFPSETRPGVQTQRFTPDIRPSQPQYIPGSPSNPVVISALSGNEVPQVQPTNQITRDNYIPVNQPLEEELPSGPPDILPNQIPQNTLSTNQVIRDTVYEWRISGLTECTHSCGGGVQQTVVVCVDTRSQATVTDENCRHLTKPKLLAVPCNKRPCPAAWTPSPWTPCSVTCGRGEQTRSVICQARVSPTLNLTMSNDKCEGQERIHNRQACENNPCSSWRVGNWSECSVKCGDGERIRKVECVDLENNVVTDDACVELKPDTEQRCNLGECGKGWFFSEWPEECPVECGTGELTRQLFCADEAGAALPESRCNENQRPASTKTCKVDTPCGGQWYTGRWSKCDAICGPGHRNRGVLCIKALPGKVFAIVGEENCAGINKPEEMEACESPPCTPQWYMTSWSQCSQSCGTGYRTREVKCLDPGQKPSGSCPLHTRPKTRDTCNTQSCEDAKAEVENPGCTDKFAQCRVVKRARLCQYGYYKNMCCKSCREET